MQVTRNEGVEEYTQPYIVPAWARDPWLESVWKVSNWKCHVVFLVCWLFYMFVVTVLFECLL